MRARAVLSLFGVLPRTTFLSDITMNPIVRSFATAIASLVLALAPMVSAVALFRDNTAAEVRDVVRQVRPALLQFHGEEDDAFEAMLLKNES